MPLYSAGDVVGKTLIPKVDMPVLNNKPDAGGVVVATMKAGSSLLVDSWAVNNSTNELYWTFYTGYPKEYRFVKHSPDAFGVRDLKDQGVLSEIEKQAAAAAANKSLTDKAIEVVKYGVLIFAGVSILNTMIKSK
ncbi:MAG: hypothetical protein ABIQ88_02395 [Chitinophagaceae bacterium]